MTLVVNTNTTSQMVQTNLTAANNGVNKAIERLSTGYRINHAGDDAAGLAIAKGFESQVSGTAVAKDNTQHGINLLQTAEGDLDVIQDNLNRIRDLTVQAANGTYSTAEKQMIGNEVQARLAEITRVATVSSFSGIKLLDGSCEEMVLQVGANSGTDNQLDIHSALYGATAHALNPAFDDVATVFGPDGNPNAFIAEVDTAIDKVSKQRSDIGVFQNRLESTLTSLDVKSQNMSSSLSTIQDTDIAATAADLTKNQILQSLSTSLLAQANSNPSIALNLI